jgi:hypothetical protein
VLRGLARTIAAHLPVIMVEYDATNFGAVRELLEPFGYLAYAFDWKSDVFSRFTSQQIDNLFFMTEQRAKTTPFAQASRIS